MESVGRGVIVGLGWVQALVKIDAAQRKATSPAALVTDIHLIMVNNGKAPGWKQLGYHSIYRRVKLVGTELKFDVRGLFNAIMLVSTSKGPVDECHGS